MTSLAAMLLVSLALPIQDPAPKPLPKVGDRAPALEFDAVLGLPADKTLELQGKVVVLEFSTSWCAGCRATVPHWNGLAQQFAGEAIAFVFVTNEPKTTAERFVKEAGLRTPLAVDLDGSLFEAFAVGGIPDAVVIGADGKIAGFTHPGKLEAADLRKLLAGEPATLPAGIARANRSWNHSVALSAEVAPGTLVVRPCLKPSGIVQTDQKTGAIFAGGVPLRTLLATVLDCTPADLDLDPALPAETLYELQARGNDGTVAGTRAFARERLQAELGIAVATSMVEGKALLLRRVKDHQGPAAADPSSKGGSLRAGEVQFGSVTAARLAVALQSLLSQPVADETGLAEPFRLDLKWDPQQGIAGLREALGQSGLSLEEGRKVSPRHKIAPRT